MQETRPAVSTTGWLVSFQRHRDILLLALAPAILTFAIYAPVLKYPFVNFDDPDYVSENVHVQQGLSFSTVDWAFHATIASNWHPLTWLSHALDCELFGLNAGGHHFTSVLIHSLNVILVFLLVQLATRKRLCSFFAAGVFAIHPLNVQCVAWVAERKSVLSMFFFLLALGAYGWYTRRPRPGRYLIVAVLFVLALMAKPMVVTFPFVLMLVDVWPLGRVAGVGATALEGIPQFPAKQLIIEKLPILLLAAVSSVITFVVQHPSMKTMAAIPLRERLANAVFSYLMYLRDAVWPAHLGVFYAPQGARLRAWQVILCLLFLAAVSALVWWQRRAKVYLLIGWLWFLGTLVPMIGIVQVGEQGRADRYAYLTMLGLFVAVVLGVADLCDGKRCLSRVAFVGGIAVLLALSVVTWKQISTWQSSYALWSHSLEITKENYFAEDYIGFAVLEEGAKSGGNDCVDEALAHFRRAVAINPQDSLGHLNIGFCQQVRGRMTEAIEEYKTAAASARSKFIKSKAYTNLATAFEQLGDYKSARTCYERSLEIFPNDAESAAHISELDRVIQNRTKPSSQ